MINLNMMFKTLSEDNLRKLFGSQIIFCKHPCDSITCVDVYEYDDFCLDDVPNWLDVDNLHLPENIDDYILILGKNEDGIFILAGIDELSGDIWDYETTIKFSNLSNILYYDDTVVVNFDESEINNIMQNLDSENNIIEIPHEFNNTNNIFIAFYTGDELIVISNNKNTELDTQSLHNLFIHILEENKMFITGDKFHDFCYIINSSAENYNALMQSAAELGAEVPFNETDDEILSYLKTNPLFPRLWGVFTKIYTEKQNG